MMKEKPFVLVVPNETRQKMCLHKTIKTSHSPGCIVEEFCADCGAWLMDKDVS